MTQSADGVPLYNRRLVERADPAPADRMPASRHSATSPTVWTDLSSNMPVSVTELEAIEAYLGALIDDLLG